MTQAFRIRQNTHQIIKSAPERITTGGKSHVIANPETPVILGYMRTESDMALFKEKRFFYCRATNNSGVPVKIDLSISQGTMLLGYTGPHQQRVSAPWCAEVIRCELVTSGQLATRAGITPSQGHTHYLLFHLGEPWPLAPRRLDGIAPPAGGLATQKTWLEISIAPVKEMT